MDEMLAIKETAHLPERDSYYPADNNYTSALGTAFQTFQDNQSKNNERQPAVTLQHMLRFCEVDECFQIFRLVCKVWKNAVETIRFNRMLCEGFFYTLDHTISEETLISTNYFDKYLPAFKKLEMCMDLENKDTILPIILKNMTKLNNINFSCAECVFDPDYVPFIFKMLQNSNQVLCSLHLPKLALPDIIFPKMKKLTLGIGTDISVQEFKTHFPKVLDNMENLDTVQLELLDQWEPIGEYVGENYPKHCICDDSIMGVIDFAPVPIVINTGHLEKFLDKKYASQIQYLHMWIFTPTEPMNDGWDRYQEIFDQCTNLREIELDENFVQNMLPNLNENIQEIWKERISYFESRGIRLVNEFEIWANENLQNKLAKEAGITWKFYFCSDTT